MTRSPAAGLRGLIASAPAVPGPARLDLERTLAGAVEAHGGAVIRTCHRIEWYHGDAIDLTRLLVGGGGRVPDGTTTVSGFAVVERLVSLALGLESVVLGEDQILHQIRRAVAEARTRGSFGGDLALAFDSALRAGRLGRTWRPGRAESIADLAVRRGAALTGELAGRRVLVVGTGEMGRLAVGAARNAGAAVAITSRDPGHARDAADRQGLEAWPFDPGAGLRDVALVIVALAGSWRLTTESLAALTDGPAIVVDLSMPGALPEGTVETLAERHIGIDDVGDAQPSTRNAALSRYRERLTGLRQRTLVESRDRLAMRDRATTARDLAQRVEHDRRAVIDAHFRRHPELEPDDQVAIEAVTLQLTERLFGPALERLARAGDDRSDLAVRDVFGL